MVVVVAGRSRVGSGSSTLVHTSACWIGMECRVRDRDDDEMVMLVGQCMTAISLSRNAVSSSTVGHGVVPPANM